MQFNRFITLFFVFLIILSAATLAASIKYETMATTNMVFSHHEWNFKSVPIWHSLGSWDIRSEFCNSSLIGFDPANCTELYFYNSTSGEWKHWDEAVADISNNITEIKAGFGYWVHVSEDGWTNELDGATIDPIQDPSWNIMQTGWNMMGWTDSTQNVIDTIPQIYGNYSKNITNIWNYENNDETQNYTTLDIIKPYYPTNNTSVFKGGRAYWVCVSETGDNNYCQYNEPPLMPWQNQRPVLTNGNVTPSTGNTLDTFNFTITYTDSDNEAAGTAQVVIDGTPYAMTASDSTYSTGVIYYYETTLAIGSYNYYFNFDDGNDHVFYDGTNTTKYPKPNNLTLTVNAPSAPPTANFTFTNSTRTLFHFTDLSFDDGSVVAWQWNFGDGTANSSLQDPDHDYAIDGTHLVTLTVWDNHNQTNTYSDSVTVNPITVTFYGYDRCNNDIGWSIFTDITNYMSNPYTCGNGKADCCGWYIKTHVHDIGTTTTGPTDLWFKTRTGYNVGCTDNTKIYTSTDNVTWDLAGTFTVIAKDMDGQYGFPEAWKYHTFNIRNYSNNFRYVKVSSPNCFDDYSEVTVYSASANQVPVANIVSPASAQVGDTVTFDGSTSFDPDGSIVEYNWLFGDYTGSTSSSIVIHIYDDYFVWGGTTYYVPLPTTITVQLIVKDNLGAVTETTVPLDLSN